MIQILRLKFLLYPFLFPVQESMSISKFENMKLHAIFQHYFLSSYWKHSIQCIPILVKIKHKLLQLASYGEKSEYVKEKNIPFTYTNFLANLLNNLPRKRKKHRNLMAVTLTPNFYLATFQDLLLCSSLSTWTS